MGLGTHGKNTRLVGFGHDLSPFFRNVSSKGTVNVSDDSTFGSEAHTYSPTTQAPATIGATGLFSDGTGELQERAEAILGENGCLIHLPEGYAAVGRDFVAVEGTCTKHGGNVQRQEMVDLSIEVMSQVGLDIGRTLTNLAVPITSAGNGTAVDFGAATANGGFGYVQLTEFTGTSVTVTIEDSADGSTGWATVGTFTVLAGDNLEERIELNSGAIKRYLRAVTAGTFTSAALLVGAGKYAD